MGKEEVFGIEKKVAEAVGDFRSGKARKSRDCPSGPDLARR
jgi:hypothetical protein